MKIRDGVLAAVVAMLVSGCRDSDGSDSSVSQVKNYVNNRQVWESQHISTYQFTLRKSCFCPVSGDIVISVVDDAVVEAFYLSSGEYLSNAELNDVYTISELFDEIGTAINIKADDIAVSYNADYGYPATISIDYYRNAIDDEVSYTVSDFHL